uniref:Uncharacterized protein n=1 Tax=Oryza punctata TaxID=4537 RepID=A0A0E0LV47_ORYPU
MVSLARSFSEAAASPNNKSWMMIVPMILPQVMQLLPQAYCLCLLNHEIGATIRRDSPIARNLPGNL